MTNELSEREEMGVRGTFKRRGGGGNSVHVIVTGAGKSILGLGLSLSEDWIGGLRVTELTLPLEPMGP